MAVGTYPPDEESAIGGLDVEAAAPGLLPEAIEIELNPVLLM